MLSARVIKSPIRIIPGTPHRNGGKMGLGLSPREGNASSSSSRQSLRTRAVPYPSELRNKMCQAETLGIIDEIAALVSDKLQVVPLDPFPSFDFDLIVLLFRRLRRLSLRLVTILFPIQHAPDSFSTIHMHFAPWDFEGEYEWTFRRRFLLRRVLQ